MIDEATLRLLGDLTLWLALALGLALAWHAITAIFSRPELSTTPLPALLRDEAELWKDLPPGWESQAEEAIRPRQSGAPSDVYDLGIALLLLALLGLPFLQYTLPGAASLARPSETSPAASGVLSPKEIFTGITSSLLLTTLIAAYLAGRRRSLRAWFGLHRLSVSGLVQLAPKAALWTAAAGVGVYGSADLLQRLLWRPLEVATQPQEIVQTAAQAEGWNPRLLLIFSACVVAPLCEEVLFRGFLYPVCRRFTSSVFATVLVSLAFGLVHANLHGVLPLALLGVLLTLAYEQSRGLALPMAMHMLFNAATLFLLWRGSLTSLS